MRKYLKLTTPITMIIIGMILYISSLSIRKMQSMTYNIGSAFLPKIMAGVLMILGVLMLINELKGVKTLKNNDTVKLIIDKRVVATLLLLLFYVTTITSLGFIISSMAYLLLQTLVLTPKIQKRDVVVGAIIAVISSILIYLIFKEGFQLRLPLGILG